MVRLFHKNIINNNRWQKYTIILILPLFLLKKNNKVGTFGFPFVILGKRRYLCGGERIGW